MSETPPSAGADSVPHGIVRKAALSSLLERDERVLARRNHCDLGFTRHAAIVAWGCDG
jgi:hypothetical protein